MFKAEERIFHIRGSRSSFDTAIPRFEAPAAYSTFHLDAEVFIGAEAPRAKGNLLHIYQTQRLDHQGVIKGPFQ